MDNLPYNLIDTVKKQGGKTLESKTGAWVPFTMRVDQKPFSDVRVRQALRLITDRQQMIDQALSGYGFLGNDLYAPFDPAYAKDLPQRSRTSTRPSRCSSRPASPTCQVQLFTGDDIGPVAPASASLFVQQAKKAGVTVKVVKKNPFYGDDYLSYPFAQDFWNTRNYLPQAAVGSLKSGTYNETHFDNPKFAGLISQRPGHGRRDQAQATCCTQAQEIEYNEGGYIIWGFRTIVDGLGPKVSGIEPGRFQPLGDYDFKNAKLSA